MVCHTKMRNLKLLGMVISYIWLLPSKPALNSPTAGRIETSLCPAVPQVSKRMASKPIRKLGAGCDLPFGFLIGQEDIPLLNCSIAGQRKALSIYLLGSLVIKIPFDRQYRVQAFWFWYLTSVILLVLILATDNLVSEHP